MYPHGHRSSSDENEYPQPFMRSTTLACRRSLPQRCAPARFEEAMQTLPVGKGVIVLGGNNTEGGKVAILNFGLLHEARSAGERLINRS